MELWWAVLVVLGIFVGIPIVAGLILSGVVVTYNVYKTAAAERALSRNGSGATFLREVAAIPGGEGVLQCIQCGTCVASCPNSYEMQHPPRRIIAMMRAGMWKEVVASNAMWYCASCYLCTARCPRGVKVTDLMYALKQVAYRHGFRYGPTGEPVMYRNFVELVNRNGRVHEMELMTGYYLGSQPLAMLRMGLIGLKMFARGRSPLKAHTIKEKEQFAAIIAKARSLEATRATEKVAA
jgi:heterodisulfide reductase subunit C